MKERPILFSAPMVRAILAGTKTQTRRVVKDNEGPNLASEIQEQRELLGKPYCPYGDVGDKLWVREAWALALESAVIPHPDSVIYRADEGNADWDGRWIPSIHMFRWASRITLEIVSVRVERVQDISEEDARAEGSEPFRLPTHPARESLRHVDGYSALWESINGPGSWDTNPLVWVVEFKPIIGIDKGE